MPQSMHKTLEQYVEGDRDLGELAYRNRTLDVTLPNLLELFSSLGMTGEAQRVQAALDQDGPGGPKTPPAVKEQRRVGDEIAATRAALRAGKKAEVVLRERAAARYPVYVEAFAKSTELTAAVDAYAAAMKQALDLQQVAFDVEDQLATITSGHADLGQPVCPSPGVRRGMKVGQRYQQCLREDMAAWLAAYEADVDRLSGRAAQRIEADADAARAKFETAYRPWIASVQQAAIDHADAPEVKTARFALDLAIQQFETCPRRTPDGQPNASGTPEAPGRVPLFAKVEQANRDYFNTICNAASIEFVYPDDLPPAVVLGPGGMYE